MATKFPQLTQDNYYSTEADVYMSNSQLKAWQRCPRRAYARYIEHDAKASDPPRKVFAEGAILDALLLDPADVPRVEKEHEAFLFNSPPKPTKANPDPKPKKSALYRDAEAVAEQVRGMRWVMDIIEGSETQAIYTSSIEGTVFKSRFDLIDHELRLIVDMKYMASLTETIWDQEQRRRVSWIEYYKYMQQLAVYRESVLQSTGHLYAVAILGIQKPTPSLPDPVARCYYWDDKNVHLIDQEMMQVSQLTRVVAEWRESDPNTLRRCETCAYCARTAGPWWERYETA